MQKKCLVCGSCDKAGYDTLAQPLVKDLKRRGPWLHAVFQGKGQRPKKSNQKASHRPTSGQTVGRKDEVLGIVAAEPPPPLDLPPC